MHIDHTTIRTDQLEEPRDFLISVFGLREGPRPESIARTIRGYWLYWKDAPLIHLIAATADYERNGQQPAEAIDHTAFVLDDYEAFRQHLTNLGIRFSVKDLPEIGVRRIFLRTPAGILLETIFKDRS
ncbi:VOC family protein [Chitinophaga rhizophila]|uniref:VOC family protein n=1 Tax=Chitinophaga rhizophila TaxID=2866212 RepID=A0ABS7G872_9BACT|nr:VOC family protein [Chitinophaga rhizophila]MBW8683844.1 VOC family protein [Chitinophaga rhizophila]